MPTIRSSRAAMSHSQSPKICVYAGFAAGLGTMPTAGSNFVTPWYRIGSSSAFG